MAGLLDMDSFAVNPLVQLGLGILANSTAPRGTGTGAMLGRGALQGMENIQQAKQMQYANQMRKLQMDEFLRQKQQREQIQALAKGSVLSPQQQAIGQFGPTPQGEAAIPTFKPKFDTEGFLSGLMGIDPLQAMQMQKSMQPEEYTLGSARFRGDKIIAIAPPDPNKMSRKEELEFQSQLRKDEREFAAGLAAANRVPEAPNLVQVDVNGQPQYVPARQAIGMKPWNQKDNGQPAKGSPEKRAAEAKMALPVIERAEKLIDSSTGSYLGNALDVAAGAFGVATPGAKSAAQLKVLEAQLIQNMPRMEGPQSDKDVALYKQAAAQIGDPTTPPQIKRAALSTLREIMSNYSGMATGGQSSSGVIDFSSLRK